MNTYRVWFDDGDAVLENAETEEQATAQAKGRVLHCGSVVKVVKVEQLNRKATK